MKFGTIVAVKRPARGKSRIPPTARPRADIAGCRALLVNALHEKAAKSYENAGFQPSPVDPLVYMLRLDDARNALSIEGAL